MNDNEQKQVTDDKTGKNPTASEMGKMGGAMGGRARAEKMSPKQRSKSARKAARAKWAKKRAEQTQAEPPQSEKKDIPLDNA